MKFYAWCSLSALVMSGVACNSAVTDDGNGGSAATSMSTATGTGGAGGFVPPAGSLTVKIGPIDVPAGVERTQCVTKRLGNVGAIHVGTIHNELIGVSHHMIVYKVSDTVEAPDPVDCQPFKDALDATKGSPLMITQKHSETLDLPEGVAFGLDDNQMVRLEMHYINPTGNPMTVEGDSTFVPMDEAKFQNEAGFLFAGSIDVNIPANTQVTLDQFIGMPADLAGSSFFAFTGHEHQFGTNVKVSMGTAKGSTTPVYDVGNFSWAEPPTVRKDPPVVLPAGNGFEIQCDWNNTSPNALKFGESATDEMCFFWGYYWPNKGARVCFHTDKVGGIDQCCPGGSFCSQF